MCAVTPCILRISRNDDNDSDHFYKKKTLQIMVNNKE